MSIYGVKLTSHGIKSLLGGVILCSIVNLTACQQAEKSSSDSSSNNDSKDLTVQPANPNNNQVIVPAPQKTPKEIIVNQPSPFPLPKSRAQPQTTPSAFPESVVRIPQNPSPAPKTQSSSQSNSSISKALTKKLSPKPTSEPNIPKPQSQPEIRTKPIPAKPVVQALRVEAKNPARKIAAASNTHVYQSSRLGVNFKYPKGFIIKEAKNSSSQNNALELWSVKDYQAVAEGSSQNSHSPGNLSISLEDNPQGLSLVQWITNNDELGDIITESYDRKIVAGREAMFFRTEGLYEFENILLPSSDGKKLILISFAQGDKSYRKVFEQVVSSLQMN